MKDAKKKYELAKRKATVFMKNGQLSAYFDALIEMNNYKKVLVPVIAN